jgi:CBS domain-containing protein
MADTRCGCAFRKRMGGQMKARDLMIPLQEHLRPDQTIKEAVLILRSVRCEEEQGVVKGLPVLDNSGQMVGFLSIGDVLKAVLPPYMVLMNLGDFTWDGMVEQAAKRVIGKKVLELMTRKVISVREDAPLMECVDHMFKHNVKRLPVIDHHGKVLGMLHESSVFCAVTRAMFEENGESSSDG